MIDVNNTANLKSFVFSKPKEVTTISDFEPIITDKESFDSLKDDPFYGPLSMMMYQNGLLQFG